jgi:hypothetical protein
MPPGTTWVKFHSRGGSKQPVATPCVGNFRRLAAIVLAGNMATSCSRTISIPRDDLDDPKYRRPGLYRFQLSDQTEYSVRLFSVTDSLVSINDLTPGQNIYDALYCADSCAAG